MGKKSAKSLKAATGLTLDAGALIALERGDRRMIALLSAGLVTGVRFRIPAGVLGQVWRGGQRQAPLARFIRASEVEVKVLDEHLAKACGQLCGAAGTSDIVDASVIITARQHRDTIVTGDPDDLRKLDPRVRIESI